MSAGKRKKRQTGRYPDDWPEMEPLPPEVLDLYLSALQKDEAELHRSGLVVKRSKAELDMLTERMMATKVGLKVMGYDGPEVEGVEVTWRRSAGRRQA